MRNVLEGILLLRNHQGYRVCVDELEREEVLDAYHRRRLVSTNFQNELLSIIGKHIKLRIGNKVREAKIFAIIADETQDIAKHEEVAVILRHSWTLKIWVLSALTGLQTEEARIKELQLGLWNKTLLQCTFAATHMYRTCALLSVAQATKKIFGGTVTLKSLNDTRWACRVDIVRSFMEDFKFVFDLLLHRRVLKQCNLLSKTLQSNSVAYEVVKSLKNSTLEVLRSFRTEECATQLFNHCTEVAEKCEFRAAELPRKGKIPAKIGDSAAVLQSVLNHVIDILEQEITARLQENNLDVLNN
ncbi:hypothetical protein PR048_018052 [Dryococelus australis]|uniref:DUF4371 domain-containing protein n=1 Tax=Dryococelus australis TaxID=614101 RepID=A0ABQ9HBB0_9NEOP|nr:hypothetical protein PR048_018052 [Dryococelus australis]